MKRPHLAILLATFAVSFSSSSWAQSRPQLDPMLNRSKDPPDIYTLAIVSGTPMLFRIAFFPYDRRFNVYQIPLLLQPATKNSQASRAMSPRAVGELDDYNFPLDLVPLSTPPVTTPQITTPENQGHLKAHDSAALPPDPDAFQFDPWDLPDPQNDFLLPDPPLPDPFNDPFVGLPNPLASPFPDDELDITSFSNGTLEIINSGQPLGYIAAPLAEQKPRDTTAKAITISVGPSPAGIVRSRDLTTAYVAVSGAGQIAVVDMVAKAMKATINIAPGTAPYSLAIAPDDKTLYVAEAAPIGGLFAVDLESGTVKQLPVAVYTASSLVLMPDATRLWICNNTGDVTVLDVLTNTIVAHLPVARPWAVAFNRTGTRAYITSAPLSGNGTVEVYDANSYSNLASIPVGMRPHGVGVTPSGRHVFVVNRWTPGSIMQISTATNAVIRTFPVGDFPDGLGMEH